MNALWDRASLAKEIGDLKTVSPFALFSGGLMLNTGTGSLDDARHAQASSAPPPRTRRAPSDPHRALRLHALRGPLPTRLRPLPRRIPRRARARRGDRQGGSRGWLRAHESTSARGPVQHPGGACAGRGHDTARVPLAAGARSAKVLGRV